MRSTVRLMGTVLVILVSSVLAQGQTDRPPIRGIAHVGIYATRLESSRAFYKDFLGFGEPFSLRREDGSEWIDYIKVNDLQYIELFAERRRTGAPLAHFALYTDSIERMKSYVQSRGVQPLDDIHPGQTGNRFFTLKDPDGHIIEILQYEPGSRTGRTRGSFLPSARISGRILHVGIRVQSPETERFYRDVLGFRLFTDPVSFPRQHGWITLRVPDGDDYLELIPYSASHWPESQKLQDHFCLEISNARQVVSDLQLRAKDQPASGSQGIDVDEGDHEEWQVNIFDPAGARVELREPEKETRNTQAKRPHSAARANE